MGGSRAMEKRGKNFGWKANDYETAGNRRYIQYWIAEGNRLLDNFLILNFFLLTDVDDSIDVDVDRAQKDETAAEADVEEDKEGEPDNEDIDEQIDSEKDERDQDRSFDQDQEDEEVKVASNEAEENYFDQEQPPKQRQDSSETDVKSSPDKEKAPSLTQDRER